MIFKQWDTFLVCERLFFFLMDVVRLFSFYGLLCLCVLILTLASCRAPSISDFEYLFRLRMNGSGFVAKFGTQNQNNKGEKNEQKKQQMTTKYQINDD